MMDKKNIKITPVFMKQVKESFFDYFELSSLLFDDRKSDVFDITDIPKGNKFYGMAKDIAKDMGIEWKDMSHQDSNRVMLALLEDRFNIIRSVDHATNIDVEYHLKIKQ